MPKRFKLTAETPKYDGSQELEAWLDDYLTAVRFQKGGRTTAMQYIQLQLVGAARSWLKSRRRNSYSCWEDFEHDFIQSFKSTCQRPATVGQLKACKQRVGEDLRGYIQRWTALKNNTEDISKETAVTSFVSGLSRTDLREYIGRVRVKTITHLMEIANSWADGEEMAQISAPRSLEFDDRDTRYRGERNRKYDRDDRDDRRRGKRKSRWYDEMESIEMVAAEFPANRSNDYRKNERETERDRPRENTRDQERDRGREQRRDWQPRKIRPDGFPPMSIEQQLDGPCPNHMFIDSNGIRRSDHKLGECRRF